LEIQKGKNLRTAAHSCGYSYRKAWNLLNQFKSLFGLTLVEKQQGKGTQLSELGKKLVDITEENNRNFKEKLEIAGNHVNKSLHIALDKSQTIRIIASDSERINKLRQLPLDVEIHIDGSRHALTAYAEKKCDIAGFHIAIGDKTHEQLEEYLPFFDQKQDHFLFLEQRQQSIISHPENPVYSLQTIVEQQLLFVNRQSGSGTRLLLDGLLKQQGISPEQLKGYFHEEHTHLAVASMIINQQADAGLGIASVAKRLNLHIVPITKEYYFLIFRHLNPQIHQILKTASMKEEVSTMNYSDFVNLLKNEDLSLTLE
jgi:molybdate transport repressor ModE-like protein